MPELEPTPDVESLMFFDGAVALSQQLELLSFETRRLNSDKFRNDISQEEFDTQNATYQAEKDRLNDQKKSIIDGLPDDLRDGADHFFALLPSIREAVANIRDGNADVHVANPQGGNHAPTIYLSKALLLGAQGTGYTLTARTTEGGYIIASPYMGFKDVEFFTPTPKG